MRPYQFKDRLISLLGEYFAMIIEEEQESILEHGYHHDWEESEWYNDFEYYLEGKKACINDGNGNAKN